LTTSDLLADYLDWPGQRQVFMVARERVRATTGAVERETVYGVTSLGPERADAWRLLTLVREHWHIENRSHWVRDVTFDEDRSQVRTGSIPQVMAALRNAVIGLIRVSGATNVAAATRRMAARPREAIALLGLTPDF
jgi:predicted transposase YbfD/YdcC